MIAGGLLALLVAVSLGEGGATPNALLAVHLCVGALVMLAALQGSNREPAARAPEALPFALVLLFVATSIVGAAAAPYGYAAWLTLVEQLAFVGVAWVAARCGPELLARVAPLLLYAAAAQGALAIAQRIRLGEARPAGTFLNTNHMAAWLVAALVLGLGAWRARPQRGVLVLRAVAALFALCGLVLSGSRGALLGLGMSVLLGGVVLLRAGSRTVRRSLVIGIAAAITIAAAGGVALRLRSADPFLYHRVRIWKASFAALAQAPFTGTGPGQFAAAAANLNFPLDDGALRYERSFTSPHSDLLRAACELGIPGAMLACAALAAAALSIGRRIARREMPASSVAAVATLAGLLAQASVDDLTDRPALYLLFAALAGSLLSVTIAPREPRRAGIRHAALLMLVAALLVGEVSPWLAWRAQHELPRGRLDSAQRRRLHEAIVRNRSHPDVWLRRAEDLAGSGTDWSGAQYARARDAAERAVRLQPADARYRMGLARIEALACVTLFGDVGTRERASREYDRAQELTRHDPFVALEQGKFLLATGDPAGARRAAERALAIEPRAVPGRLLLAESIAVEPLPGAHARARALLQDADETALRFRDAAKDTHYARALLRMDEVWRRSIEARLAVDSGAASP